MQHSYQPLAFVSFQAVGLYYKFLYYKINDKQNLAFVFLRASVVKF